MGKKGLSILQSWRLAATRKEFEKMGLEYEEYQDSPWATGKSASYVGTAGHWHFPGPDVQDEMREAIRIEPLKQGFLVKCRCIAERAFTDHVDAAKWLLGWLGFEDEIVESVLDILWDADELYVDPDYTVHRAFFDFGMMTRADYELEDRDCAVAHVALAAWAYTEAQGFDAQEKQYQKLVEAVKKWRGIDGEPYTKDAFRNDVGSLRKDFLYESREE